MNAEREERAVVTGGSRGIGLAIAAALTVAGRPVTIVARDADRLGAAADSLRRTGATVDALACDLTDRGAVGRLVGEIVARGPVGVLVNNAGIGELAPLADTTDDRWDRTLATDLTAAFMLARGLAPSLAAAAHGSIVNVSSSMGIATTAGLSAYSAAKAGLQQLTRALAVELGPLGIRSNAVAPGFIETDLFHAHHPPARQRQLTAAHPLRRLGGVDEVAAAVEFLASRRASFVTGAVLTVDGGLTCELAIPSLLNDDPGKDPRWR